MASYSVKAEFRGATVFLTGATGYIGGLVLEKLLRSTDVELVYVLLRPKGASSVEDRLTHLLQVCLLRQSAVAITTSDIMH